MQVTRFDNQDIMKNMIFPTNTSTRFFQSVSFYSVAPNQELRIRIYPLFYTGAIDLLVTGQYSHGHYPPLPTDLE